MRAASALLCLLAAPAAAGGWFLHEFGELRAYHGDWLTVCADAGAGACRAVQFDIPPGTDAFFGVSRLALHRIDGSPDWAIEVYDKGLLAADVASVSFDFGDALIEVPANAWRAGDYQSYGAVDQITVTDAEIAQDLVDRIRAGRSLTVTYAPSGDGDGMARFSLRGATSATDAVQARVLARQE